MKFILIASVLILAVLFVEAAVFRERAKIVDGKCKVGDTLRVDGEEWPEPDCIKRICDVNAKIILGVGCGKIGQPVPKGCRIVSGQGDNPDCCPKVVCDRPSGNRPQTL